MSKNHFRQEERSTVVRSRGMARLASVAGMDPWLWIPVIYGAQMVASLLFIRYVGLGVLEMRIPLFLLIMGVAVGVAFAWRGPGRVASWRAWLPAGIYALFIISLSNMPFTGVDVASSANWLHVAAFSTLGVFLCCGWHPVLGLKRTWFFIFCVLATGGIFALSDELHQMFVPGRSPSLMDFMFDMVGLSFGTGVFLASRYVRGQILYPHITRLK